MPIKPLVIASLEGGCIYRHERGYIAAAHYDYPTHTWIPAPHSAAAEVSTWNAYDRNAAEIIMMHQEPRP